MVVGKDCWFVRVGLSVLLIIVLFASSCRKSEPEGEAEGKQKQIEKTNEAPKEQAGGSDMVALDIELPEQMFVGTSFNSVYSSEYVPFFRYRYSGASCRNSSLLCDAAVIDCNYTLSSAVFCGSKELIILM